jgi:hypothetical protein
MAITLSEANQLIDGALARARSIAAHVSVSVCDPSGHLIAHQRMDGAPTGASWGSIGKAVASAQEGHPSGEALAEFKHFPATALATAMELPISGDLAACRFSGAECSKAPSERVGPPLTRTMRIAHVQASPRLRRNEEATSAGRRPERQLRDRIGSSIFRTRRIAMKWIIAAACSAAVSLACAPSADAKGCIKGAIVGGAVGHMAGHGKLGAAAGSVVGHHEANKADANKANAQAPSGQNQK